MKRHLLIKLLFLFPILLFGQKDPLIDSLKGRLQELDSDTERVNTLNRLAEAFRNRSADSAARYVERALTHAKRIDWKKGQARSHLKKGLVHYIKGSYDKAMEASLEGLELFEKLGDDKGVADAYHRIGIIHHNQGNIEGAIEHYTKSLKIRKRIGDRKGMAASYGNLGLIHKGKGNYAKALDHLKESLTLKKMIGDKKGMSNSYNNLGSIYFNLYSSDREGLDQTLKIDTSKAALLDSARNFYRLAFELDRELRDKWGMTYSLRGMGDVQKAKGRYQKAIHSYERAASLADSIGAREEHYVSQRHLAFSYEALGQYQKAFEHFKEYNRIKDSVLRQKSRKQLAKMEAKYKKEKRKRRIEVLKKEKEKQAALARERQRKQNIIIAAVSGGLLMVLLFALALYHRLRLTRRQKATIEEQKLLVEEKQEEIAQSIDYAQKIQEALLQTQEDLSLILPEHFILFKPQATVSGDFYWSWQKGDHIYVAAVDCTGHGVPGAFMSMLGVSFLNDIMATQEDPAPGKVLTRLRRRVVRELSGSDPKSATKDGMDAALVKIPIPETKAKTPSGDEDEIEVEFAGAQNPLYVIRKGIVEEPPSAFMKYQGESLEGDPVKPFKRSSDGIEIKGDKQPVGYDEYAKDAFTTIVLKLRKGDMLYFFSDGYADQFGGPKGKKFQYGPFKRLLASIHERPLEDQKQELDKTFEKWKNESQHEQIDDVVVIGVRLNGNDP
ncbi:MAG: tetratricopeptide repeat protein [Flavobacteriales bacterium]